MACFAVSAVVACTAESPLDASPDGSKQGGGATGSSDVVSGGQKGGTTETTATGLPCDVDAVLKTRCQTCHSSPAQFGASAPLVTYDDLQKAGPGANAGKKVYELVHNRIHDASRLMNTSWCTTVFTTRRG